jgi:epoxyqueuosine reductase QueG
MMSEKKQADPAAWIKSVMQDFLDQSPENTLQDKANEKAFDACLLGFSKGDDPIYDKYKEVVGPFHWTPLEIFTKAFPESKVNAEEITVISWVLPHREATKADNRKETAFTSERWARARIFGEQVNAKLRKEVVDALQNEGHEAVAPQLFPDWSRKDSEKYVYSSTWSERHATHASGLGTFGLCDGLITPVGKAMRVGSVVANIDIPPTPRPYTHHQEYCLFLSQGLCKQCIPRCPVGALSENGHDKEKCRNFIRPTSEKYVKAHFGFDGYGCGLCQTGVSCESKIPTKEDL